MSSVTRVPDYELAEELEVSSPEQLRALADRLRSTLLDLLLERAATVNELACAVGRPPSSVAHHVKVLVNSGLLRVVGTKRVRAIDERYYGRTARLFRFGMVSSPHDAPVVLPASMLSEAAAEAAPAYGADRLAATLRHVRISEEAAQQFWERVLALGQELVQHSRSGDTVYGFVAGIYPTDQPTLPAATDRAKPDSVSPPQRQR